MPCIQAFRFSSIHPMWPSLAPPKHILSSPQDRRKTAQELVNDAPCIALTATSKTAENPMTTNLVGPTEIGVFYVVRWARSSPLNRTAGECLRGNTLYSLGQPCTLHSPCIRYENIVSRQAYCPRLGCVVPPPCHLGQSLGLNYSGRVGPRRQQAFLRIPVAEKAYLNPPLKNSFPAAPSAVPIASSTLASHPNRTRGLSCE